MTETTRSDATFSAPQANPELLGHEAAEATLLRAFRSGRLPHAWLITGPRGVGKATLAFRFARFLLAGGGAPNLFGGAPESLALDPADPVFQRVAAGGHPDLRHLKRGVHPKTGKPRNEIVVDDVRLANDFLHKTSAEGGWRVVVVDPADDLNPNAANALLKSLEEPPAAALLLLVSHAPGRLLATIRSRCCHLALGPLPEERVAQLLARHAPALEETDRAALARLAEGSIGRALDLAAGGGLELYREMIDLVAGLPALDVPRVHAFGDTLARERDGATFRTGMELLIWWLARLARAAAESRMPPEVVPGEAETMARLIAAGSLARWPELWEKTTHRFAGAEGVNLDRKQVVITTLLDVQAAAA
jgi:DNA polymerase-3 subunit delta'